MLESLCWNRRPEGRLSGALSSPALKHPGQPAFGGFAEALVHADTRFAHRANDDAKGDALRVPGEPAGLQASMARCAASALRSMHGTCTGPQIGSQVRPG